MLVVQKFARSNAMLYCYMSAGEGLVLLLSFGFLRSVGICGYLVSIWNLSFAITFLGRLGLSVSSSVLLFPSQP